MNALADMTVLERFEKKYEPVPDAGCWIWTAHVNSWGYGTFGFGKPQKSQLANRVAWMLYRGPIPQGMRVLHRCDVPSCVNPAHLFLGTDRDNVLDSVAKGRWPSAELTHCKQGHEFTPENTLIRPNGRRRCYECHKKVDREYKAKKRREKLTSS